MDGIDARVGCRGGWYSHEASHISVGVGVWGHAWRGDALWRHETGPSWAPRSWTGPQGVLQLKREGGKKGYELLVQKLFALPWWLSCSRSLKSFLEISTWSRHISPTTHSGIQGVPATIYSSYGLLSSSRIHVLTGNPTSQGQVLMKGGMKGLT